MIGKMKKRYWFLIAVILIIVFSAFDNVYQIIRVKKQFTAEDYDLFKNVVIFKHGDAVFTRIFNDDSYYTAFGDSFYYTDSLATRKIESMPDSFLKRFKELDVYAMGNLNTLNDSSLDIYVNQRTLLTFRKDSSALHSQSDW